MLSINNQPLPMPSGLQVTGFAGLAGGEPHLLRVSAHWPALGPEALARICSLAQGGFTLGLVDPRSNTTKGYAAGVSDIHMSLLGTPGEDQPLWQLHLVIDQAAD